MPVNPVFIWCGASSPPHPSEILGSVEDGIFSKGLLWNGIPGIPGGVSHHLQYGGERSGSTLVRVGGREIGRTGLA